MNWQNTLTAALPAPVKATIVAASSNPMAAVIIDLIEAGKRFDARTDSFAAGKGATCRDIADKVSHFGSFASDKQAQFAAKLVEWSKPRVTAPAAAPEAPVAVSLPFVVSKLFAVLQKHSTFHLDGVKLSRKNQDTLVWIMAGDLCVGKIDNAVVTLFAGRIAKTSTTTTELLELLAELERDPLAGAQKYGKLSGRCCSCGRDLTDPDSIELGIGPQCRLKFGA